MLFVITLVVIALTGTFVALYARHVVGKMAPTETKSPSLKVNVEKPARTLEDTSRRLNRIAEMRT